MQRQNDQPLKEVLQAWIQSRKLQNRLNTAKIREVWETEMGTSINTYTTEIKIFKRKLFISISSASLRQELSFSQDKIKKRMNEALGEEYIESVVVRG